jgi:hypothetical protein
LENANLTTPPWTIRTWFERELPTVAPTPNADYIAVWGPPNALMTYDTDPTTPTIELPVPSWDPDDSGPPRPTMLRIRFTIEDPTGRLPDGQTFEYIINVQ